LPAISIRHSFHATAHLPTSTSRAVSDQPEAQANHVGRWTEWLPRMLLQSVLVAVSIVFALWVDEWSEDQDFQELAERSLVSFEREIEQNMRRLEDVTPFHIGLRDVVGVMTANGGTTSLGTFRNIIDGFEPAILVNTAWETGVATGAVSHIEYDIVAGLSLTYGIQDRLNALNSSGLSDLLRGGLGSGEMEMLLYAASRYLRELAEEEQQLQLAYAQILELLRARNGDGPEPETETGA